MKLTNLCLLCSTVLVIGVSSVGAELQPMDRLHLTSHSAPYLEMDQLLKKVKALKVGSVISAELEDKEGRPVYEIQTRDENQSRWEILVDAGTGEVIGKNQR